VSHTSGPTLFTWTMIPICRWPLPSSTPQYGAIDGRQNQGYVNHLISISEKSHATGINVGRITGTPSEAERNSGLPSNSSALDCKPVCKNLTFQMYGTQLPGNRRLRWWQKISLTTVILSCHQPALRAGTRFGSRYMSYGKRSRVSRGGRARESCFPL